MGKNDLPFKLQGPDEIPEREGRGGAIGVEFITLDFTASPTGRPVQFFKNPHYGFAIVASSDPGITGLTFFLSRPRNGITGVSYRQGMQFVSTTDKPIGGELWYQKTATQAMTVTIAVFLRPMAARDVATPRDTTQAVSWSTQAQITVNGADTAVFAANPNRRAASFFNASTGGQRIAITTENPATGVARGILFLDPGVGVILGPQDGTPVGIIRAWASAAGGLLNAAEGN